MSVYYRLIKRIEELERALLQFARIAETMPSYEREDNMEAFGMNYTAITYGEIREAARAMNLPYTECNERRGRNEQQPQ
jgi:hypothetical protein